MAHYAYLNKNNLIVDVIVGKDETELIDGLDTETYYAKGTEYRVKRASYNSKIRGNYAGKGMFYCDEHDLFMIPKCHDEAVLNVETARWDCTNTEHDNLIS
jgi:hypothetical protein